MGWEDTKDEKNEDLDLRSTNTAWPAVVALLIICATIVTIYWITRAT